MELCGGGDLFLVCKSIKCSLQNKNPKYSLINMPVPQMHTEKATTGPRGVSKYVQKCEGKET